MWKVWQRKGLGRPERLKCRKMRLNREAKAFLCGIAKPEANISQIVVTEGF